MYLESTFELLLRVKWRLELGDNDSISSLKPVRDDFERFHDDPLIDDIQTSLIIRLRIVHKHTE